VTQVAAAGSTCQPSVEADSLPRSPLSSALAAQLAKNQSRKREAACAERQAGFLIDSVVSEPKALEPVITACNLGLKTLWCSHNLIKSCWHH